MMNNWPYRPQKLKKFLRRLDVLKKAYQEIPIRYITASTMKEKRDPREHKGTKKEQKRSKKEGMKIYKSRIRRNGVPIALSQFLPQIA
jgi:hypothetical protein